MGSKKKGKSKATSESSPARDTLAAQRIAGSSKDGDLYTSSSSLSKRASKPTLRDPDLPSLGPPRSVRGWSGSGTWPRKANPSTQVARETILAEKTTSGLLAADFSRFEPGHTGSTASADTSATSVKCAESGTKTTTNRPDVNATYQESNLSEASTVGSPAKPQEPTGTNEPFSEAQSASGWLGWVSYGIVLGASMQETSGAQIQTTDEQPKVIDEHSPDNTAYPSTPSKATSNSWFGLWAPPTKVTNVENGIKEREQTPVRHESESTTYVESTQLDTDSTSSPSPQKGSSWGFWSKQSAATNPLSSSGNQAGELAITGRNSQNHPLPAHTVSLPADETIAGEAVDKITTKQSDKMRGMTTHKNLPNKSVPAPTNNVSPAPSIASGKSAQASLLVPPFGNTYRQKENPSIIQQITRLLVHSNQPTVKHLYLTKDPPRIRKALAIGIHGLFPASFLRPVIGQPTGTSIRFANHAADAIQRWSTNHGHQCSIEKIALEGEGKIAERVDNLWKLLLNWVDHIRESDYILIACHSQGVPVALILVAKLIEFGVVSSARIGVCAMAGVSLGPFAEYKARFFGGSTAELFEFADPDSEVSKRYEECLCTALNYGVRVTYVGSIDDQLVSLESAVFSPANHPYIYRAVFVDGRVHASDFIAHLVGFALKLRNLGVSDHGLIRELSAPLAGSLYTGGGHSSLYDETKIYDLATAFSLETSSVGKVPLEVRKSRSPSIGNPFQLPWSMRGLLEEDLVRTELDQEAKELLKQFDEWKPVTKGLKDVKYRLEAVRSKL